MEELALKVEHVSKEYRLGQIGGGTLKAEIQSKIAKWRHKEDPNLKIGEKAHEKNERFLALDDVSFEIKKGEKIGIIGHNGAGKSTILKLICRVTAPTKGNIYLNGRITSMLEVGTGFHGELTGRENIYLNGSILGMSKAEIDEKIDEIIEFSEVKQFIDTPVKRYSSGMHVKLGFAVASHLNSEIMIMDEVLAVGDMAFQKKCIDRMRKVADEEGRTILYVSHNMNTIRQLCDRCIVLNHGTVAFIGNVEDAINVYMGDKKSDDLIEKSLIDAPRYIDDDQDRSAQFNYMRLLEKNNNVFSDEKSFDILLRWSATKQIRNTSIRFVFRNKQNLPVASSLCFDFGETDVVDNNEYVFRVPIDELVNGKYDVTVVLLEKNELGRSVEMDVVIPAFSINIKNTQELIWSPTEWSNIRLADSRVISEK